MGLLDPMATAVISESPAEQVPMSSPSWRCVNRLVSWSSSRVALAFAVLLALAVARAPFTQVPDALFVSDGFGYYIYLPSLVIDHDLDLTNQLERLPYEGTKQFFRVAPATGRHTNQFPVGCAIFWLPFFLIADLAVQSLSTLGITATRSGFGWAYEMPVYAGSFAYGLAGVWLMQRVLREAFDDKIARLVTFGIVFATPLGYYLWLEPNMSHSVAFLLTTLWVFLLMRIDQAGDRSLTSWALLGVVLGLVALVRPYSAVLGLTAIPIAICVSANSARWFDIGTLARASSRLLVCLMVSLLMLAPQVYVWQTLYGEPFVVPRGSGYEQMSWFSPALLRFLVSIYAFFPILLPATAGLAILRWRGGRPVIAGEPGRFSILVAPFMLLVMGLFIYLVSGSRDWMLGTAFGQRRMVDWSIFYAFGLGMLFQRYPRGIQQLPVWFVVLALGNFSLMVLFLLRLLPQYGMLY